MIHADEPDKCNFKFKSKFQRVGLAFFTASATTCSGA